MISFSIFKNLLGKEAEGLSDEEIRRIRDDQYKLARIAWGYWKKEVLKMPDITIIDNTSQC